MQTVKMLKKNLRQRLVRGVRVVVSETYGDPELRGKEMALASKTVVECKGKGRCAHDNCVGLAAFVTDPDNLSTDKADKKSKPVGWRSGTTKICLTHLKTPEGDDLVPDEDDAIVAAPSNGSHGPTNRVREHLEPEQGYRGTADRAEVDTSWEALAQAASTTDRGEIVRIARALKRETEQLRQRLMDTQERLLARMG